MNQVPDLPRAARLDRLETTDRIETGEVTRSLVGSTEIIPLFEETLHVSKRDVVTGTVRVSIRTEVVQEAAEVMLERTVAEVTRVPVGRLVEEPPAVRTEGDVTIVPVFEERYVTVKQLYLTEELHIRHNVQQVVSHAPVSLRRETAVIERLDAGGRVVPDAPNLETDNLRTGALRGE